MNKKTTYITEQDVHHVGNGIGLIVTPLMATYVLEHYDATAEELFNWKWFLIVEQLLIESVPHELRILVN